MHSDVSMDGTIIPSVFLPFEIAVVLYDSAAVTIDDHHQQEGRGDDQKFKGRQTEYGNLEDVSVVPVPEPGYTGPQPSPEQAQGQGRYQFRGSEGSSS